MKVSNAAPLIMAAIGNHAPRRTTQKVFRPITTVAMHASRFPPNTPPISHAAEAEAKPAVTAAPLPQTTTPGEILHHEAEKLLSSKEEIQNLQDAETLVNALPYLSAPLQEKALSAISGFYDEFSPSYHDRLDHLDRKSFGLQVKNIRQSRNASFEKLSTHLISLDKTLIKQWCATMKTIAGAEVFDIDSLLTTFRNMAAHGALHNANALVDLITHLDVNNVTPTPNYPEHPEETMLFMANSLDGLDENNRKAAAEFLDKYLATVSDGVSASLLKKLQENPEYLEKMPLTRQIVSRLESFPSVTVPKKGLWFWGGKEPGKQTYENIYLFSKLNPQHKRILITDNAENIRAGLDKFLNEKEFKQNRQLTHHERQQLWLFKSKLNILHWADVLPEKGIPGIRNSHKLHGVVQRFILGPTSVHNYALVSDIVRLAALYKYGGTYMDCDAEAKKPLPQWMRAEAGLLASFGEN